MAKTTESTQYAKLNTLGLTIRPESIDADGRKRYLNDVIVTTTDNAANDTIRIPAPPRGAYIDKSASFIVVETAPAGTVTADLGPLGALDTLSDGMNLGTAGKIPFSVVTNAAGAALVEYTGTEDYLVLTLKTMTTPAAGTFRVSLAWFIR